MRNRNGGYVRRARGAGMGISAFLFAIILAVSIGYVGTKYIIYPLILQEKTPIVGTVEKEKPEEKVIEEETTKEEPKIEEVKSQEGQKEETEKLVTENKNTEQKQVIEDKQEVKVLSVYALQFGVFSDKTSANNKVAELKEKGVNSSVYEGVDEYKVFGNSYASKEKAMTAVDILSKGGIEAIVSEDKS